MNTIIRSYYTRGATLVQTDSQRQAAITEMYSYHPGGGVVAKKVTYTAPSNSAPASGSVEVDYSYAQSGKVSSVSYPMYLSSEYRTVQGALIYGYDGMGRPVSLTDYGNGMQQGVAGPRSWASNAQYDAGERMTAMQEFAGVNCLSACTDDSATLTRGYNAMGQLASLGFSGPAGYTAWGAQYGYAAGQNNGQIAQITTTVGGSTAQVTYQYDALRRLIQAASTGSGVWTETYQLDGFGNLTGKTRNGATTALGVNGATNRLMNAVYDANGNMTGGAGASITYDAENRVSSVTPASGGTEWYGYSPENKRVLRVDASGNLYLTLYGVRGEKLTEFQIGDTYTSYDAQHQSVTLYTVIARSSRVWFAGRLVRDGASMATPNQIGSNAQTYPYGEEIGAGTANDRVKFATYTRDSFSGLDYADQRWYASGYGRFTTSDPYRGSAGASDPGSWNRYAYVQGDPINFRDPSGLFAEKADTDPVFSTTVVSSVSGDIGATWWLTSQPPSGLSLR